MTDPRSDDERFAELIASEFAVDPGSGPAPREPAVEASEPFRTWSAPEEPEEDFVPPPVPPRRPWHRLTLIGTLLVGFGLVMVVVSAFGVRLPMIVAVLAGASVFAGTAILLHRLSQQPPSDSDGAVV